ncbi:MAG: HYR domain-containing protein, partial [Bacteroidetes bacterium]|nr:HYR domain-containing protein [Bacteroidota bacterium]
DIAIGTGFGSAHGDQITVTLTADDGNGNTETCEVVLTLSDDEFPSFTDCPTTIELCGEQAVSWTPPTAADNCSFSVSSSHQPGDVFPVGVTVVSYTVTDAGGNQAFCDFEVVIHALPDVSIAQTAVPEFCQGLATLTAQVSNEPSLLSPLNYLWTGGLGTNPSIVAQDNGLFTVAVTDSRGCSNSASYTLNLTPSDVMGAYTLLAKKRVKMKRTTVHSGGVGVFEPNQMALIQSQSVVNTFVKAPNININGGSIVANQIIGRASFTLPEFKDNNGAGNIDVTVQVGQTQTLTGNDYGIIELKENATVIFDNPQVLVKEFKLKEDVSIEFLQPTELILEKTIELEKNNLFNVGGESVTVFTEKEFIVNEGSMVIANVFAKKSIQAKKAKSNNHTSMNGLFITIDKIFSEDYVDWNSNPNCNLPGVISPVSKSVAQSVSAGFEWSVYPNPASETVTIDLPDFGKEVEVVIYDMAGKRVWNQEIESGAIKMKIDVSGKYFKSAVYLVHVVGNGINLSKRLQVMK